MLPSALLLLAAGNALPKTNSYTPFNMLWHDLLCIILTYFIFLNAKS